MTAQTTTTHDHERGHRLRALVGVPGVWVQRHGDWQCPLHVWLYRGAWRALCFVCMTSLSTDDDLYGGGYRTQSAAFDAAHDHCRSCPDGAALEARRA